MIVKEITNGFLTGLRSAPQEEIDAWYCKLGQESMFGELTGPRCNPITIMDMDTLSNCLLNSLYIHKTNAAYRRHQRRFSVPWTAQLVEGLGIRVCGGLCHRSARFAIPDMHILLWNKL